MSRILMCTMLVLLTGYPAVPPPAEVPALRHQSLPLVNQLDPVPGETPSRRSGEFGWPLPGVPRVTRAFEQPAHRFGPGHRGTDLAGPAGTPVLAAGSGTVVFAGLVAGRPVVSVDHRGGLRTTYEPVSPRVSAGDLVVRGQLIGTLVPGHDGCPAAACLHWGARRGMDYLDPLGLLALGEVRLLPWVTGSAGGSR
jgi:murein DD-endopeptidase MepM/ murein hydrolase activator NlpD